MYQTANRKIHKKRNTSIKMYAYQGNLDSEHYMVLAHNKKEASLLLRDILRLKARDNIDFFISKYMYECLGVIITPLDTEHEGNEKDPDLRQQVAIIEASLK